MRKLASVVAGLGMLLSLASCDQNQVFEQNLDLDKYVWTVQQKPAFTFDIQDTTQRYDIYFNVRNQSVYGYYNLYVKHTLQEPSGKRVSQLLHQMLLMDPQTGEPRGQGSGDIFDHQFLALRQQQFHQTGTYKIILEQYMRQDQLPGIMAVGVRVAKTAN
ncbi:gliding motility lipoprotein GldH [Hymenobacter elongatus]|uniref:Gliding motility lipoprotein GldH n=1 Tax=Hymenobacter elongatus TaxID=877208 RepID=A0A4Z0PJX1_9BACT|nr:gliding motility lipoprotein GldH [Hymenobacter elongatus]TGE14678.1 gliding motility lipoprotein GldH [Hymenobacter elongatus]